MTASVSCFSLIISGSLLLTIPVAQAGPMQDIGASSGPQCVGLNVNDSGYVVGICSESNGSASGFVAQAAGNAVDLAHLVAGRNCAAGAITNVGRILGRCFNSNSLYTGSSGMPRPHVCTGFAGVGWRCSHQSHRLEPERRHCGVSVSADNTALPVMWRNNETTARSLPAGLLGLVATNCMPADIDDYSENSTMPSIVGNCPGSNGRPQPVLWSPGLLGAYASAALPLPADALYCRAGQLVNARILGQCDFGAQGGHAVLWNNPTSAPMVLTTGAQRSVAMKLNSHGQVIGKYANTNGDSIPFIGIARQISARIFPRRSAACIPR